MSEILVFTDGATSGNPGPGGWGAVIATGDGDVLELGGSEAHTTNNRMELRAPIEALRVLAKHEGPIVIYSDSAYVINGITKWIKGWKRRDWLTAEKTAVLNKQVWLELESVSEGQRVSWRKVPAHAGVPGNERADAIASAFARNKELELYCGAETDYPVKLRELPEPGAARPSRKSGRSGKAHAYLSLVGGEWQRHQSWRECEARVKGVSGARFQKVLSESEIEVVLKKWNVM